eukprot:1158672-Pelagomonas_calceolata.AAC.9
MAFIGITLAGKSLRWTFAWAPLHTSACQSLKILIPIGVQEVWSKAQQCMHFSTGGLAAWAVEQHT